MLCGVKMYVSVFDLLFFPGLAHKQRISNIHPSQIFQRRSHLAASSCCRCRRGRCRRRTGCFWTGWRVRVCRTSALFLLLCYFSFVLLSQIVRDVLSSQSLFCLLVTNSLIILMKDHCKAADDNLEPDGNVDTLDINVWFTLKQNVASYFSPVHCWTWIHYPLQVLQHHQLHLHLGEVGTLFPSDPKLTSCERAFQVLN